MQTFVISFWQDCSFGCPKLAMNHSGVSTMLIFNQLGKAKKPQLPAFPCSSVLRFSLSVIYRTFLAVCAAKLLTQSLLNLPDGRWLCISDGKLLYSIFWVELFSGGREGEMEAEVVAESKGKVRKAFTNYLPGNMPSDQFSIRCLERMR